MDPIEAEAHALLLGAKLTRALNLQDVNFLTDNEILARGAQAGFSTLSSRTLVHQTYSC